MQPALRASRRAQHDSLGCLFRQKPPQKQELLRQILRLISLKKCFKNHAKTIAKCHCSMGETKNLSLSKIVRNFYPNHIENSYMKVNFRPFMLCAAMLLAGCASSSYNYGKNFETQNISKIQKGQTTSKDLVSMFGEPFVKTVVSTNEEKWMYIYTKGTAKAQNYIVTMKVNATGEQKTLDVLLKDGVVVNYTYNEGQNPYNMRTN